MGTMVINGRSTGPSRHVCFPTSSLFPGNTTGPSRLACFPGSSLSQGGFTGPSRHACCPIGLFSSGWFIMAKKMPAFVVIFSCSTPRCRYISQPGVSVAWKPGLTLSLATPVSRTPCHRSVMKLLPSVPTWAMMESRHTLARASSCGDNWVGKRPSGRVRASRTVRDSTVQSDLSTVDSLSSPVMGFSLRWLAFLVYSPMQHGSV